LTLTEDVIAKVILETARPLVLYGESLGTAMALRVAADDIGDAIVLEAPFTSFLDILAAQYPLENLGDLCGPTLGQPPYARGIRLPLRIIHGEIGKIVPIVLGCEFFAAPGSAEKQFLEIASEGHRTLWTPGLQSTLYGF
jgi:alpha-beta hydrolase superfamily lysophospholipase